MNRVDPIAKFGAAMAVLWTVVSIWQPDTTFHFGPLIISFTLAAGLAVAWYLRLLVAAGVTLLLVAVVVGLGGLAGPDFFGSNAAAAEAILFTATGAFGGTLWGWIAERRSATTAGDSRTDQPSETGVQLSDT